MKQPSQSQIELAQSQAPQNGYQETQFVKTQQMPIQRLRQSGYYQQLPEANCHLNPLVRKTVNGVAIFWIVVSFLIGTITCLTFAGFGMGAFVRNPKSANEVLPSTYTIPVKKQ